MGQTVAAEVADNLEVKLGLYNIGDWYVLAWVGSGESENEDSDETNEEE